MADKKLLLITFLLIAGFILSPIALADILTNYSVYPNEVALGNDVSISGTFVDDLNSSNNIPCAYYITDENGTRIYRMSDTRTDQKGNFFQKFKMTEPRFLRGTDYNVLTICDEGEATKEFTLGQRDSAYHITFWEFNWLTNENNMQTAFWYGLIILVIIFAIFGTARIAKGLRKRF